MSDYDIRSQSLRVLLALALATIPLGIALFIPLPPPAHAAGFTVNDLGDASDASPGNGSCLTSGGVCTLRAAIQEANALSGSDTITFSVGGTIVLGSSLPDITQDLTITGPGADNLKISGNNSVTVLLIFPPAWVILTGVTIADGLGASGYPGGIMVNGGATLSLNYTDIYSNSAPFDAGVLNYGTLNMSGGKVYNNIASNAGGGISNVTGGSVNLNSVAIFSNTASGSVGGGIKNSGSLYVINTNIYSNTAHSGAGVSNGGTLTIKSSAITNNIASINGGALYNTGGAATIYSSTLRSNTGFNGGAMHLEGGSVSISSTLFERNNASSAGGGIRQNAGSLTITNTTFYSNTASSNGGAVYVYSGTLTMMNNTIANNASASGGGGIANSSGSTTLRNTIVANNPTGGNCAGTITSGGNNLQWNPNSGCGTPAFASGDPRLAPLGNYGGPTQSLALYLGSAAINTGNNDLCPSTDQRGVTRPLTPEDPCDKGAFEGAWYPLYLPLIIR